VYGKLEEVTVVEEFVGGSMDGAEELGFLSAEREGGGGSGVGGCVRWVNG